MISASLGAHVLAYAARYRQNRDGFSARAHLTTLEGAATLIASLGDNDPRIKTIEAASRALGAPAGTWQGGRHQQRVLGDDDIYRKNQKPAQPPTPRAPGEFLADLTIAALEDIRERHAAEIASATAASSSWRRK